MERIAAALDYLAGHHVEPIRVGELARLCHVSVTHFRRLFNQAVGRSPAQYLQRLRVRMAAALLESTDRKVLDVSLEVGYPTLSSFNRHFRSVMGMAPREWRQKVS
jgi:transcriptional regulator GlxA family with amidase domain